MPEPVGPVTRTSPLFSWQSCRMCCESPELLGRQDLGRDDAEHRAGALAIDEDVGAKARQPGDLVREVGVVPLA